MFAYGAITSWIFEGAPLFPKAEKRKLSTIELPKVDAYVCRVRKTKVSHEVISGHRTGWFKEEEYYVPLEQGSTLLSRKRACRHRKTLGAILLIHGFAQNRKLIPLILYFIYSLIIQFYFYFFILNNFFKKIK